jgi:DNA-binding transcriptional LysR family regulator
MLNPLWLQTFATAAASASFTEAGRQLGLTQSTVSDHIRRLEESLGGASSCAIPTRWR